MRAIIALLLAVLSLSLVPLVIELALFDSNPFIFAATQTVAQIAVLVVYLRLTAKTRFGTTKLREIVGTPKNLLVSSHTRKTYDPTSHQQATALRIGYLKLKRSWNRLGVWAHTPLLWAVIVGLEYSLLSWSTIYIDTAVSTMIYGIWPLVMMYALVYLSRNVQGAQQYHIFLQKKILTGFALVGIVFVAYGQIDTNQPLLSGTMLINIAAMMIAFFAAVLNAMNPAMTINFADLLYQIAPCRKSTDQNEIARQKLWLSICAVTAGRILSVPLNIAVGFTLFTLFKCPEGSEDNYLDSSFCFEGNFGIELPSFLVALGAGIVLLPAGSILLRLANLSISDLSINALCYAEPVFSLIWIMSFSTIDVPRFDLFIVGAGIIAVTNILIQVVPDINLGARPDTGKKRGRRTPAPHEQP